MSIFDDIDEKISRSEALELLSFKESEKAEIRYWNAYKNGTPEEVEHASILEKWALAKSFSASSRTRALENIKMLEPVRNFDIEPLRESLNEILKEAEGNELSVFISARLDSWAKSISPAFSFVEWGDVKKGTQGFFPVFNIHFPKGKWTPEMMQKINIMARVLRRDIDYMVDFNTTKEGAGKKRHPFILSISGEGMHLAAANYSYFRHKRPKPFTPFRYALDKVSFHGGDQSYKK